MWRMPSHFATMGRTVAVMYESFFEMNHTPFTRGIPAECLYMSSQMEDAIGRLKYGADHQLFSVVIAESGCGKSTMIRRLSYELPPDKYQMLYLSDSKLTPRWLYAGLLDQMGLAAKFYRGDSKRILQKEIRRIRTESRKNVVCVLDEAHLLEKDTLEEFRFLLNEDMDSVSPMSLVLVGQTELWEQKLRLQLYAAIEQRIDTMITLNRLDRSETGKYIAAHLAYAGGKQDLFTTDAEDQIYKVSAGIPRMINRVCSKMLMYAYQQQNRLIDGHMVRFVSEHEMVGGVER